MKKRLLTLFVLLLTFSILIAGCQGGATAATTTAKGTTPTGGTTAGATRLAPGVTPVTFTNKDGLIIYKDGVDVTKQYSVTFVDGSLMVRPKITYVVDVSGQVLFTEWVDYGTGDASYGLTPPRNISYRGSNYYWSGSYSPATANDLTVNTTIRATYYANKRLTITADSDSRVYNGSVQSITTATLSDPSLTVLNYTVSGSGTDVGLYPVTVTLTPDFKIKSGGVDVTYQYDVRTMPGVLTITPATLPVSSSGYSGVYDGNAHGISVSTSVEGARIIYSLVPIVLYPNQSTSPTLTNVGSRTVYFRVTKDNYWPYYGSETINISPVPIVLTAQSQDFTYDGAPHTWHYYGITSGSFVGTQGLSNAIFSPASTVTNVSDSGKPNVITGVTYKTNTRPGNYSLTYLPGVLNVLRSEMMSVGATPYSELYDGSAHGITASAYVAGSSTPITAGTEIRYSTGAHANPTDYLQTTSPTATHVSDSLEVFFVATNPNYFPAYGSARIDILQRSVILKSATASKVFDNTALMATTVDILGDGFVEGEGFITPPTASGSVVNVGPAVSNTIIVPDLKENTDGNDYEISQTIGSLSITPRTVTVVMDAAEKNYSTADPAFTYSFKTGANLYDILAGTGLSLVPLRSDVSAATAEDVGIHVDVISANVVPADSTAAANYTVTIEPADFTINPQIVYLANTTDPVTGMPATQWFKYNSPAVLSNGGGVNRVGYILTGWQPEAVPAVPIVRAVLMSSTPTSYALGETIPLLTKNLILNAVWTPAPYAVAYVPGAAGVTNMPVNAPAVLYGSTYTVSAVVPVRAGFTFAGWGTTTVTGVAQTFAAGATFGMPANNVVLSANWVANLSPVIYHANGGNGATYTEGTHATLSLVTVAGNTFTRPGYRFIGWSETPTGAVTRQPGNTFVMPATEVNFYAQWEQLFYTVTYMVSGGTLNGLDGGTTPFATYTGIAYGAAVPVPTDPAQAGYNFDGWTTAIPTTMPDRNLTIYGSLTPVALQAEVIPEQQTPLAGPTWSLVNLILTALSVLGLGTLFSLLNKKRAKELNQSNKMFRFSTLIPAIGAALAFFLTQVLSGSMVIVDRWTILFAGIFLIQAVLLGFGFRQKAPKA